MSFVIQGLVNKDFSFLVNVLKGACSSKRYSKELRKFSKHESISAIVEIRSQSTCKRSF